jgi:16S rRNA (guanine527-N7)-methyltransferase
MRSPQASKMTGSQIRTALDSYRDDAALAPQLTARFLQRMETFAAALALWGARMNLTAKPQDSADIAFHIADSLMPLKFAEHAFVKGRCVLDFGSGAGFPGLVLASACDAHFTLAEARQKRASFLKVVAAEMGLDNLEVLSGRLRANTAVPAFHAALSRASGPPADFHAIAAAALLPNGLAILYSTPSQRLDLASAQSHGLTGYERHSYSLRRGAGRINRVLAVWRKAEKVH